MISKVWKHYLTGPYKEFKKYPINKIANYIIHNSKLVVEENTRFFVQNSQIPKLYGFQKLINQEIV